MIVVFVEGGGSSASKRLLRTSFGALIRSAVNGCAVKVIACGSRNEACQQFCQAMASGSIGLGRVDLDCMLLLVDAESSVTPKASVRAHLGASLPAPVGASIPGDSLHLMVECMENWLLADPIALAGCFGRGFDVSAMGNTADVETIPKAEALRRIKRAVRSTPAKTYSKTDHGLAAVARLNPSKLRLASVGAAAFFDAVLARCKTGC